MARKSILTLYNDSDWSRAQPDVPPHITKTFAVWNRTVPSLDLYRASLDWYRKGVFTRGWIYRADGWHKINRSIKPTAVFDKTATYDSATGETLSSVLAQRQLIAKRLPVINTPEFSQLVDSKLYQAVLFERFMPKTHLWLPGQTVRNPRGKTIVLKSLDGSGGTFVTITKNKRVPVKTISVQQEFIAATTKQGLRDFRVCFIGSEPQYAYNRVAAAGSLYTNVHMGAHMEFVSLNQIKPLLRYCREIDRLLNIFPKRIYSMDFLIDARSKKPYLIETNSMPGTQHFPDVLLARYLQRLTKEILN